MRISNKHARQAVEDRQVFTGSNTYGTQGANGYAVYSYGSHFPIYAFIGGKWYGNKDKYSTSTSRHQSQLRPSGAIEYIDTEKLQDMIG